MNKKYICFCNECGIKKKTDNRKEFEFCPNCGHVNTGVSINRDTESEDE